MGIVTRPAGHEDAQLVADLTRRCWADKIVSSSSGHHESAQSVLSHLQVGGAFILEVDGAPTGSVRWLPLESDPDSWEILRMGVLPGHRGRNLSQHLLEAVIHHAQDSGVCELRLAVRGDQPMLVDYYAALGFEPAHELEHSFAGDAEPTPCVMRRLLD